MSKPTRRKISDSKSRARSNSARFTANGQKKSTQPKTKTSSAAPKPKKPSVKKSKNSGINNQPAVWTKEKSGVKHNASGAKPARKGFGSLFAAIGRAFGVIFGSIFTFITKNKLARLIAVLLCLVVVGGLIDHGVNYGKIYPGVKVGEIELGGKTAEEAEKLIESTYSPRLMNTHVYIFANEEASKNLEASLAQTNDESFAEQHSVEEVQANKLVWQTDAGSLGANLDTKEMVRAALALGREDGGIFARLVAGISGSVIDPWARYDQGALEALAQDIDLTIGDLRVNYGVSVIEGHAEVIPGHDGTMIDRKAFEKELDNVLLLNTNQEVSFIAQAEYAPLQIDEEKASKTAESINQAIMHGVRFMYHGVAWDAEPTELGSWIQTRLIESGEDAWELEAFVSYDLAKVSLQSHLRASFNESEVRIGFVNDGGSIQVHTQSSGTIPKTREAIDNLNTKLFNAEEPVTGQVVVEAESASIPETMSLQDALDTGVVEKISDFTTEYTANVENRNHNIHLVSDLLHNSIVKADGGVWSFNETAGNCNEEAGFRGAGSIINGEYVDEIGGGICQVATTVFNAVYNSGLPIVQRHNHSLYIASYPAGRDAAVSWPDLDLRWKNDTTSDILLQTSYTDTSISVVLYGINPDYQVSTSTGNWEEGEKYKKRTVTDETLSPGESYIKTYGSDGSKISVVRTVKDRQGTLLYENVFNSVYEPKDEITVEGPKKEEQKTAQEPVTS
ncbi:MAG: VanW family protein [Raoultibacter sp.]